MPASRSAQVETSYTRTVLDALVAADDFVSLPRLHELTKIKKSALRTTLRWLRLAGVVDSVESSGLLYWYATPSSDKRTKVIDEHRREDEPRQPKRRTKGVAL